MSYTVPQVHNNGTSAQELIRQICAANTALDTALEALSKMSPNARDYYLTDNFKQARDEHAARIQSIQKIQDEIMEIGGEIDEQARDLQVKYESKMLADLPDGAPVILPTDYTDPNEY
jgi:hypothetical protein